MKTKAFSFFTMEFSGLAKQVKLLFLYPIMPLLFIIYSKSFSFGIWMLMFMLPSLALVPFMKEDNRQVDIFYSTLPAYVKDIVTGRFLYMSFVFLFGLIAGAVMYVLSMILGFETTLLEWVLFVGGMLLIAVSCAVEYLFFYRVGAALGKSFLNIIILAPGFIVALLFTTLKDYLPVFQTIYQFITNNWILLSVIALVVMILLILLCIKLSIHFYEKREV